MPRLNPGPRNLTRSRRVARTLLVPRPKGWPAATRKLLVLLNAAKEGEAYILIYSIAIAGGEMMGVGRGARIPLELGA